MLVSSQLLSLLLRRFLLRALPGLPATGPRPGSGREGPSPVQGALVPLQVGRSQPRRAAGRVGLTLRMDPFAPSELFHQALGQPSVAPEAHSPLDAHPGLSPSCCLRRTPGGFCSGSGEGLAVGWGCEHSGPGSGPGPVTGSWALGPSWWGWAAGGTDLAFAVALCYLGCTDLPFPWGDQPPLHSRAGTPTLADPTPGGRKPVATVPALSPPPLPTRPPPCLPG